jgi:DNA repair protein RadC
MNTPNYALVGYVMDDKPRRKAPIVLTSPEQAIKICSKLKHSQRELVGMLMLNGRHHYIKRHIISIGSAVASIVDPIQIFKAALMTRNCQAYILFHNHPSGDPEPSEEDIRITKRLQEGGQILNMPMLDHIIIAKNGSVSLRGRGLM